MPPKKKRGALQSPIHHTSTLELWQLAEPQFEKIYWWNDPSTGKAKLNKNHPELDGRKDERKRRLINHAPIVWELLRRHADIVALREDFSKFLAPRPPHDLLFNENAQELLLRFGFELEFVLIACGLTAWQSSRKFPDPFLSIVAPGAFPIVGNWKRRFEELMEAYRQISIPKDPFLDFWPAYDILAEARSFGASSERLGIKMEPEIGDDEPLSPLIQSPFEITLIAARIRTLLNAGYRVGILAYDPSPGRRARVIAEIDRLLYNQTGSESDAKHQLSQKLIRPLPPRRRPRPEQLAWIFEMENGNETNRSDYTRALRAVTFPLLPCHLDPEYKDTLTERVDRVKRGLQALNLPPWIGPSSQTEGACSK